MPHSICRAEADENLTYFKRLWRTLLAPNLDARTRLEQLFDYETTEFDLNNAFLSHIDLENETEHFEIVHGSHEIIQPGTTVPLSKTYCRKTIADPKGTLAVSDALTEGWADDTAYETFELESYLGTTVTVNDGLYGTLCFADTAARDDPIRDKEKALVELHALWVQYALGFWDGPPTHRPGLDTIEERAVSSDAIDSMMTALGKPTRRVVLMTLVGETTEVSLNTLERRMDGKNARVQLLHTDLPHLDSSGYIEWDDDSETISRGSKFSEVEPLLQLLEEYNRTFSE